VPFCWGFCGFGPLATAVELISALMALTQKAFTAPSAVAAYRWPPTAHPGSHPSSPFRPASCSCCSGMIYIQSEHVVRVFYCDRGKTTQLKGRWGVGRQAINEKIPMQRLKFIGHK